MATKEVKELRKKIEEHIERLEGLFDRDLEEKDVKFVEGEITALNDVLYLLENIDNK